MFSDARVSALVIEILTAFPLQTLVRKYDKKSCGLRDVHLLLTQYIAYQHSSRRSCFEIFRHLCGLEFLSTYVRSSNFSVLYCLQGFLNTSTCETSPCESEPSCHDSLKLLRSVQQPNVNGGGRVGGWVGYIKKASQPPRCVHPPLTRVHCWT